MAKAAILMDPSPSPDNPIPTLPEQEKIVAGRKFRRGPDPRQPVRIRVRCRWCGGTVLEVDKLISLVELASRIQYGVCPHCKGQLKRPTVDDVAVRPRGENVDEDNQI